MRKMCVTAILGIILSFATPGVATQSNQPETVIASYYYHGTQTANGEKFRPDGLTAAHRTLPFGTNILVTNLANDRQVKVRVNDRGPFIKGRSLDLSRGSARQLGMIRSGVAKVTLQVLNKEGA